MSDNVIQIKNWLRTPAAFKGLDKQIDDLNDKFEELLDSKYQTLEDLDSLLQWAIEKNIDITDSRVQEGLQNFSESLSLDEQVPVINTFADISRLVEEVDEILIEKIVTLTERRLEALRLKWKLVSGEKL